MTVKPDHPLEDYYTGFPYPATDLLKFIAAGNIFTIMLKSGDIVHHTPNDILQFKEWLSDHNVTDIK